MPSPTVGGTLRAARESAGLSRADLADRTKIAEPLIDKIEADDFSDCGGDFFARGHLRLLARTLGIDPTAVVDRFDVDHVEPEPPPAWAVADRASAAGGAPAARPIWAAAEPVPPAWAAGDPKRPIRAATEPVTPTPPKQERQPPIWAGQEPAAPVSLTKAQVPTQDREPPIWAAQEPAPAAWTSTTGTTSPTVAAAGAHAADGLAHPRPGGRPLPARVDLRPPPPAGPRWRMAVLLATAIVLLGAAVFAIASWRVGSTPKAPSAATAASPSPTASSPPAGVDLQLRVAPGRSSFIKVTDGAGRQLFAGVLSGSVVKTFRDAKRITVDYADTRAFTVVLNGASLGPPSCPSTACVLSYEPA